MIKVMYNNLYITKSKKQGRSKRMSAQEGTKVIRMWFTSDEKSHPEETKGRVQEFYATRFNVLMPIFISSLVFIVEIYSKYYVSEECVNWLDICRLFNTTFSPTHIATAAGFIYQHFSLDQYYNNSNLKQTSNNIGIKSENVGITIVSTILMAIVYIVCCFRIGWGNQIFLLIMQGIYVFIIIKYCISDKVISYEKRLGNIVSY